jgi:REP element-mobilizing transposase RayT
MPNHIHGIITLIESGRGTLQRHLVGANCHSPQEKHINNSSTKGVYIDTPLRKTKFYSPSGTIGAIIRGFKSVSTKRINLLRNKTQQPIWQRNYYEHIIRNDKDLNNVREYIINNPMQWQVDEENPG